MSGSLDLDLRRCAPESKQRAAPRLEVAMRRTSWSLVALSLTTLGALSACQDAASSPDAPAAGPASDGKGDRASSPPAYHTVGDRPLSASANATLKAALAVLTQVSTDGATTRQRGLAAETLARLAAGDVRIGALETARGVDLWHMCRDLEQPGLCPETPPEDADWTGDSALRVAIPAAIDGYQWGDRIYFAFAAEGSEGLEPETLAVTLVHEVNHVLNRSECSYYADVWAHKVDDTLAFLEEYRAFIAECVHRRGAGATVARCDAWANAQLTERDYGFSPDLAALLGEGATDTRPIAQALFADDGQFGWLTPRAERWPEDFAACEPAAAIR